MKKLMEKVVDAVTIKLILKSVGAFSAALIAAAPLCYTSVYPHELVVEYRLGMITDYSVNSGPHWVWPIVEKYERYDTRDTKIEMKGKRSSSRNNLPGVGTQTKEGYLIGVVVDIHYSLDRNKSQTIVESFGIKEGVDLRSSLEERIEDQVASSIRATFPHKTMEQLIDNPPQIIKQLNYLLGKEFKNDSFAIERFQTPLQELGILITDLTYTVETTQAYKKAELELITEVSKSDKLKAEKENLEIQIQLLKKQREMKVYEANTEKKVAVLKKAAQEGSLEEQVIRKWDGAMPSTIVNGSDYPSNLMTLLFAQSESQNKQAKE